LSPVGGIRDSGEPAVGKESRMRVGSVVEYEVWPGLYWLVVLRSVLAMRVGT
jgi:hypothetical protein